MNGTRRHGMGIIVCRTKRLTPPFQETAYYKQLTREGKPLGIRVIVFCPPDVDWQTRHVEAWRCDPATGRWVSGRHPLPSLIYDRCYYADSRHYQTYKPHVLRLSRDPDIQFLGRPLGGKLSTHEILVKNPGLLPYLPPTTRLTGPADVREAIRRYGSVLIKPNAGSHGRGVAAIQPDGNGCLIRGRSPSNQAFRMRLRTEESLTDWLARFTGSTRYVVQPFLRLITADGRPFDLRILVQKDGNGRWATTGMAVRAGSPGSLTSNLHGGGKAEKAVPFLERHFPDQAVRILADITMLSEQIPKQIEREHGRLLELGLDAGIDRQGRVWLLEANSKPGRSVFLLTGEKEIRRQSVRQPMLYARTLVQGLTGGSV